jgi:hypothetical protein
MHDYYTLVRLVCIRSQEAQAFATRERLAASLRPARRPQQFRFSSALRQLGVWCLGLTAVSSHRHGPVTPHGLHQERERR